MNSADASSPDLSDPYFQREDYPGTDIWEQRPHTQPIRFRHSLMTIILYRHSTKFSTSEGGSYMTLSSDCSSEISQGEKHIPELPSKPECPTCRQHAGFVYIQQGLKHCSFLLGTSYRARISLDLCEQVCHPITSSPVTVIASNPHQICYAYQKQRGSSTCKVFQLHPFCPGP